MGGGGGAQNQKNNNGRRRRKKKGQAKRPRQRDTSHPSQLVKCAHNGVVVVPALAAAAAAVAVVVEVVVVKTETTRVGRDGGGWVRFVISSKHHGRCRSLSQSSLIVGSLVSKRHAKCM